MKRKILFYSFLFLSVTLFAQNKSGSKDSKQSSSVTVDTGITLPDTMASKKHSRFIHSKDTLTESDYMMSIERINETLNTIRDSARLGFEIEHFGRVLTNIMNDVAIIRKNIKDKHSAVNIKNLYLYQSFATNMDNDNARIRAHITSLYKRTYNAKIRLKTIFADSIFRALYSDKIESKLLNKKLDRLERKWNRTDSIVKAGIDSLNALKVIVADNSMNLSNILNMLDRTLDKAKPQIFGPEIGCLWQLDKNDSLAADTTETLNVLRSENKAMGYYISQTSDKKIVILLIGILLFIWLFFKRKLIKHIKDTSENYNFLHFHYLNTHPVASLSILLLSLMPFFDAYAPTSYIVIEYILLLAAASVIFFKQKNHSFLFYWFTFVLLFIADILTYLLIKPTLPARFLMLAIHLVIIGVSFRFYKIFDKETAYYKWIKPSIIVNIVVTSLAVICNMFGRFSLAGILGISGIFAITQALVFPIFIDAVSEIILLQLLYSRLKKGVDRPFDGSFVIKKFKMPLLIISLILWVIMLTSNLNIYHDISNAVVDALFANRTIGNISFKLISVLLFIIIIWSAHILQQLISFLFGETGNETEDSTTVSKGQHSRLLIIRLLVLVGGYLLAIMASGLPIDKLTIVLGALGVGIGMGLQNVVNNFVSGIILIFDHSIQIGDEIEISGQAGRVKEIGLRASTINTSDGAEVIIPNGTILSQNIVNWTYTNDQKRVTILFTLSGKELDANVVNEIINTTVKNIPNVIVKRNPVILYTNVMPESLSLSVHFWSTIGNVEQVTSQTLLQLSAAFSTKNIGFNKPLATCQAMGK